MSYIHGYSEDEQQRLIRQNEVLAPHIYQWVDLSTCKHVVEVGCGVGAQMITLLDRYPHLTMTGIEHEARQLHRAEVHLSHFPQFAGRYHLIEGDAEVLRPVFESPIDGALMVWVLEHVRQPDRVLRNTLSWLPPDCPLWITEVFHPSFHTWPYSEAVMDYWEDTLAYQRSLGGDPAIGIRLTNLLTEAGFDHVTSKPHLFFLDGSNSSERSVMLAYWLDLMRSAYHETESAGFTTFLRWHKAEKAMRSLMERDDSVFYYSFIQSVGKKRSKTDHRSRS